MSFFPKRYFYDKSVLLLLSVSIFLVVVIVINISFRIANGQGVGDYFVQYRSTAGIGAFTTGSMFDIVQFVLFTLLVQIIALVLSVRTYIIKRELSLTVLSFGILLLLITAIVSNALLALR